MTNDARRRAAASGLDWRFDWLRSVIRSSRKANVLAVAAALAARAHNAEGTVFLSVESLAAEIGRQVNHTTVARGELIAAGFLTDTGRTRSGCKVWYLTCPPIATDGPGREVEERVHERLSNSPKSGLSETRTVPNVDSPKVGIGQSESRTASVQNLDCIPASGIPQGVPASDIESARERDACGPLGAAFGDAPLTGPRTDDGSATGGSSADLVAGPGRPAEHDALRAAGGHDDGGPAAPEDDRDMIEFTCHCGAGEAGLCPCGDDRPGGGVDVVAAARQRAAAQAAARAAHAVVERVGDVALALVHKMAPGAAVSEDAARVAIRKAKFDGVLIGEVVESLARRGLVAVRHLALSDGGRITELHLPHQDPPLPPGSIPPELAGWVHPDDADEYPPADW